MLWSRRNAGDDVDVTQKTHVYCELKELWVDEWRRSDTRLRPLQCEIRAASLGGSRLTLAWEYGADIKQEDDLERRDVPPCPYLGWWVRLVFARGRNTVVEFVGRIRPGADEIGAARKKGDQAGRQSLVAYGGEDVLSRLNFTRAVWQDPEAWDGVYTTDRLPDFNPRRADGSLLGNCAPDRAPAARFGRIADYRNDHWTHRDVAEYVLEHVANAEDRPQFTLGGATKELDDVVTHVPTSDTENALRLLRRVIAPQVGFDFVCLPTEAGYELRVFALLSESVAAAIPEFDATTAPINANTIVMNVSQPAQPAAVVEVDRSQVYDVARVFAEPSVCICSIGYATNSDLEASGGSNLERGWTDDLEAALKAGTGSDEDAPEAHDQARARDELRTVYRLYRAPADWDLAHSDHVSKLLLMDADGKLESGTFTALPHHPQLERRCLTTCGLRAGARYDGGLTTDRNPAGMEPHEPPPIVAVYDEASGRWAMADRLGDVNPKLGSIGVQAVTNDWAVMLSPSPPWSLARGRWSNARPSAFDRRLRVNADGVDDRKIVVTLAIVTDYRAWIEAPIPAHLAAGDGSAIEHVVKGAELRYIAPQTVTGVSDAGELIKTGSTHHVLNDPRETLSRMLVGMMARYQRERVRAAIPRVGIEPSAEYIGAMLEAVDRGGDARETVEAPITSVSYTFSQSDSQPHRTVLRAGHASGGGA